MVGSTGFRNWNLEDWVLNLAVGGARVSRRILFQTLALVACCLSVGGGCAIYGGWHGLISRGDWALEMGRLCPWGTGSGGCEQPAANYGEVIALPDQAASAEGAPIAGLACGPRRADMRSGGRGVAACHSCDKISGQTVEEARHQTVVHGRFHPVPTRPVFTPWLCPQPAPRATEPGSERSVPRLAPTPEPRMEVIPTPAE